MYNHAPEHYLCPFCLLIRSIAHEPTAAMHPDIVYHTSAVTALLSAHQWPKNHGNVIVVPHEHFENIYDLPLYLASPLHELVTMLALALQTVYACEGISTRQHNEPAGNQDVWHYHVHVTPRYTGEGFYRSQRAFMPQEERAKHAQRLRAYLVGQ